MLLKFFEEYQFDIILIAILVFSVLMYFLLWELPRKKRRTVLLSRKASLMKFSFNKLSSQIPNEIKDTFYMFKMPGASVTNIFKKIINEKNILYLFDYEYSVSAEYSSQQTVAAYCLDGSKFPRFTMNSKVKKQLTMQAFERIGVNISKAMTGYHKIDFSDHQEFDTNYQLHSYGEKNIKHLFNDSLLSFFCTNKGWSVEGDEDCLLIYQHDKLVKPQDLEYFILTCREIANFFKHI